MNTTSHPSTHTYKAVAVSSLNVGDEIMRACPSGKPGTASLYEVKIVGITLAEEGYISLRLDNGDLSMCEARTRLLVRAS